MKKYLLVLLLVLVIPSVALASWWNPLSWKIFSFLNKNEQPKIEQVVEQKSSDEKITELQKQINNLKEKPANTTVGDIVKKDSNNNGMPDWEESLQKTLASKNGNDLSCSGTIKFEGGPYDLNGLNNNMDGYYRVVKIGKQCWLKDNLNVGSEINGSINQKNNKIIEKYCYDNNSANCKKYGGLYQWAEAVQYLNGVSSTSGSFVDKNVVGICPSGWHIPSNEDWSALEEFLSVDDKGNPTSSEVVGDKLREKCTSNICNSSNFSSLESGDIFPGGSFHDTLGLTAHFWSSSINGIKAYSRLLNKTDKIFSRKLLSRDFGYSIRCLKD